MNIVYNMQKEPRVGLGVSPAYLLSQCGTAFGPADVLRALPGIRALDPDAALPLRAYQPEVFDPSVLSSWTPAATADVRSRADELGLQASQFVAHYLGEILAGGAPGIVLPGSAEIVRGFAQEAEPAVELTVELGAQTMVVPILPGAPAVPILAELLGRLGETAMSAGLRLGVEQVAGGPVGTIADYFVLCEQLGAGAPGISFDTGNAHAAGDEVPSAIRHAGEHIVGLHLCDHAGDSTFAVPGEGAIDWDAVMRAVLLSGYQGSLDVEVRCESDRVHEMYTRALRKIASVAFLNEKEGV